MNGDLLTLVRRHDLPPKWNGLVVSWRGWEPELDAFVCPPPRQRHCCPGCGSPERLVVNRGLVALSPLTTLAMIRRHEANRKRLGSAASRVPSLQRWRLWAYRCQECMHDTVWDHDKDEWWELDHTDYGDEGSVDPEGRW